MDPTYPLVPVANFVACILVFSALSRSMFNIWSIGVCSFAFWVVTMAIKVGVNAIIWSQGVENLAPIWCDIMTHFEVGSVSGVPASSFVIIRRLSLISRGMSSQEDRRTLDLFLDLLICIGCPVFSMSTYYIVQGARFEITEEVGCTNCMGSFGLANLLINAAPIVLPLVSLTLYSPRLILLAVRHRRELRATLSSTSTLSQDGFLKLLALGFFDITITFPLATLGLVSNMTQSETIGFWPGWSAAHSDFGVIVTTSAEEWKSEGAWSVFNIKLDQWSNVLFAVAFFALFGLTEAKREWYRSCFLSIKRLVGLKAPENSEVPDMEFSAAPGVHSSSGETNVTVMSNNSTHIRVESSNSKAAGGGLEESEPESYGTKTEFVAASRETLV